MLHQRQLSDIRLTIVNESWSFFFVSWFRSGAIGRDLLAEEDVFSSKRITWSAGNCSSRCSGRPCSSRRPQERRFAGARPARHAGVRVTSRGGSDSFGVVVRVAGDQRRLGRCVADVVAAGSGRLRKHQTPGGLPGQRSEELRPADPVSTRKAQPGAARRVRESRRFVKVQGRCDGPHGAVSSMGGL